jgi:Protein of unknown function (DUF2721)
VNFLPEPEQLAAIFSQALAPAFLLGAITILTGGLSTRLTGVIDRIRSLNEIADSDSARGKLKADIPVLKLRAVLLQRAAYMTLTAGMTLILLLVIWVASAFMGLQHIYGGGLLFGIACVLLGLSFYNFAREVKISLAEFNSY